MAALQLQVECKYVTEDYIREWKTSSSSHSLHVEVPPVRFLYELCWTVVRGELPLNKYKLALESVEFSDTFVKEEISSLLADTIAHMGQELNVQGELRLRLIEMAKWLVDNGLVSLRLLHERCEAEFLWEAEMIKIKAPDLKSKEVRVNTRLLYQQTKFNLLREESEGYAKLVTLLCQRGSDGLTEHTIPAVISTMKSLIGHFDLDPNRVFDIVLECYELQPENHSFLALMPLFPKSHTSHILGFKFQYYQRPEVESTVPDGLYVLAATLIKSEFIDLDSVYAHLVPKYEDALADYEEILKRRLDEANKIGKINLAATGKDLMEEEKPGDVTIDLFAALNMEVGASLERAPELLSNQKLGLLHGFLSIGDWPHAYLLFERLGGLNLVAHPKIYNGLFQNIENEIVGNYKLVRPPYLSKLGLSTSQHLGEVEAKYNKQYLTCIELSKEFFQMLSCVGPYLYQNALLLQKVCRVLRGYYTTALSRVSNQSTGAHQEAGETSKKDARIHMKEVRLKTEEALGNCLLPSLQLLPANPAVGLEIWEVMSLLPYEARYRLYGEWERGDDRNPMLVAACQTAKLDTRRILKRLAKENLKQLGRMVAKIAHANPMTVLRTIVHQIEAYKDMITPVVDAFKYLTQLEYDVLEYVVIERLAQGGREKLKEDGLNLSDWLQSLASFWGHLCKKYPTMELRGLFQYLVNQLKKGEGIELVVLQELIQQMANVEYTENMTEEQLEAMAGNETLRYQATAFGAIKNNKTLIKSTVRLRDALLPKDEPKLAIPLLLLISQHRSRVVINADAPHIKMVSEQFDRCHGTLLQYVDFLTSAVTPATLYAQLIPTLDDLLHKYHIEPEVCFLIYRPVLHLFEPVERYGPWAADSGKVAEEGNATSELALDRGPNQTRLMWSELLNTVQSILPPKAWNSLSPELYTTFWTLTLQDIYVPKRRYENEMSKQHAALKLLEESSDNSHTAITKRKKDKEKIQEVLDRLSLELQKQEENVNAVRQRLLREKDSWLSSCRDTLRTNIEFLQRCIFPRCVFSMLDAMYCAKFVHLLHSMGTPYFNTVNHVDLLICQALQPMISCCTEYEAGRLGKFLYETLKMIYHWKSLEAIYDKECGNMPGFAVMYRDPNSARVTFTQFVKVHWKWSNRITKLLVQCLESTEYIEIRNALTVLTKISSVFPVTRKTGTNLEKRVGKIKSDEREDLKVLATGVAAALAARKNAWVTDEDFVMGLVDLKPVAPSVSKTIAPASSSSPTAEVIPPASVAGDPNERVIRTAGPAAVEAATLRSESFSQGRVDMAHTSGKATSSLQAKGEATQIALKSGSASQGKVEFPVKSSGPSSKEHHISLAQGATTAQGESMSRSSTAAPKHGDEAGTRSVIGLQGTAAVSSKVEDISSKALQKFNQQENEGRPKRSGQTFSSVPEPGRTSKSEPTKEDLKNTSYVLQGSGPTSSDREPASRAQPRISSTPASVVMTNGSVISSSVVSKTGTVEKKVTGSNIKDGSIVEASADTKVEIKASDSRAMAEHETERVDIFDAGNHLRSRSPHTDDNKMDDTAKERAQKRPGLVDETEKSVKRRKGDGSERGGEVSELRTSDREKLLADQRAERPRSVEHEKSLHDDRPGYDKMAGERSRERTLDRMDRDYRAERPVERGDRLRDEHGGDRFRDRSVERLTRERSADRVSERSSFEKPMDRSRDERLKDDRSRPRYDQASEQPHADDRFPVQNLPPPPPLPPNIVPQSLSASTRRDDDESRRTSMTRPTTRSSPRREDKVEKKRPEDGMMAPMDESRRWEEETRDRKREERESLSMKDRDRDKDKSTLLKEEDVSAGNSKRRRLKRDHISSAPEPQTSSFVSSPPPPPPTGLAVAQHSQQYEREREITGGSFTLRSVYEEPIYDKGPSGRVQLKDIGKAIRREHEQNYDRDWEDEKRQRADMKRRHHRK